METQASRAAQDDVGGSGFVFPCQSMLCFPGCKFSKMRSWNMRGALGKVLGQGTGEVASIIHAAPREVSYGLEKRAET